jgi:hypothetical protein
MVFNILYMYKDMVTEGERGTGYNAAKHIVQEKISRDDN